jgi:hypothetical protein
MTILKYSKRLYHRAEAPFVVSGPLTYYATNKDILIKQGTELRTAKTQFDYQASDRQALDHIYVNHQW